MPRTMVGQVLLCAAISCGAAVSLVASVPESAPAASVAISVIAGELLSPGASAALDLAFTNPNDFPVSLTGLQVSVGGVDAPQTANGRTCTTADFAVFQAAEDMEVILEAKGSHSLGGLGIPAGRWPRVSMHNLPANQDGCKAASLTLLYTASRVAPK